MKRGYFLQCTTTGVQDEIGTLTVASLRCTKRDVLAGTHRMIVSITMHAAYLLAVCRLSAGAFMAANVQSNVTSRMRRPDGLPSSEI